MLNERTALLTGAVIGAAVGAVAAFLCFTERGRAMRDDIEPVIGRLTQEAGRLQGAVEQIRESVAGPAAPASWPRPHA